MTDNDTQSAEPVADDAAQASPEQASEETGQQSEAEPEGDKPEGEATTETKPQEKTSEDDDEEDDSSPKRRSRSQRQRRRIERLERENAELRGRDVGNRQISQADFNRIVDEATGPRPKEADFNGDYLAYDRALLRHEIRRDQMVDQVRAEHTRRHMSRVTNLQEAAQDHLDRVAEFRKQVPDFDKAFEGKDLKASPLLEESVIQSDQSAQLVYHLAKNPRTLDRINSMTDPVAVARAVGRLEGQLSLPSAKKQTQAPRPLSPPRGGASPASQDRDLDNWLNGFYGPSRR